MTDKKWDAVGELLGDLYRIVNRLEELFPGRKFTPDGHLVGSIGEAIAAYMFDLELLPASAPKHDAVSRDGKTQVQIKLTQGKMIGLRSEPEHLIVLRLNSELEVEVVYNGSGANVWPNAGDFQRNGARTISLSKLRQLDSELSDSDRVPLIRQIVLDR